MTATNTPCSFYCLANRHFLLSGVHVSTRGRHDLLLDSSPPVGAVEFLFRMAEVRRMMTVGLMHSMADELYTGEPAIYCVRELHDAEGKESWHETDMKRFAPSPSPDALNLMGCVPMDYMFSPILIIARHVLLHYDPEARIYRSHILQLYSNDYSTVPLEVGTRYDPVTKLRRFFYKFTHPTAGSFSSEGVGDRRKSLGAGYCAKAPQRRLRIRK